MLMDFRFNYSSITRQLAYNTKNNNSLDATKFIGWTPFLAVGQNFTLKLTIKTTTNLDVSFAIVVVVFYELCISS